MGLGAEEEGESLRPQPAGTELPGLAPMPAQLPGGLATPRGSSATLTAKSTSVSPAAPQREDTRFPATLLGTSLPPATCPVLWEHRSMGQVVTD